MARNRGAFNIFSPGGFMVLMGVITLGLISQMAEDSRELLFVTIYYVGQGWGIIALICLAAVIATNPKDTG